MLYHPHLLNKLKTNLVSYEVCTRTIDTHSSINVVVHGTETPHHSSIAIPHNAPSGATISMSNGKRTKPRTSITPQQLDILKQAYLREQRPTKQTREDLMAKTGLDMKVNKYMSNRPFSLRQYILCTLYVYVRNCFD